MLGFLRWLPAVAWVAFIFALASVPDLRFAPQDGLDFLIRTAGHMAIFGILAVLIAWAWPWRWPIASAFALTAVIAITDELYQGFVPGRVSDPFDVFVDMLGAAAALLLWTGLGTRSRFDSRPRLGR